VTSVQSALVADCGVAVLGGTAGVGLATASQFAEQGARVVLLGRNHERGAAACQKIHLRAPLGDPRFVRVDATDPDDTVRAEQECRSVLGSIDVLVNTTGPSDHPRLLHTIPIQFVQQRINEIILPPLHMMHAASPAMRGNGSGSIISVAIGVKHRASIASRGRFALGSRRPVIDRPEGPAGPAI
jgi:2-hydroxycyclohexanecarboxyl-CoA dehydrogenase